MNERVMPEAVVVSTPGFGEGAFDSLENLFENEKVFTNSNGLQEKMKKSAPCTNNISGREKTGEL